MATENGCMMEAGRLEDQDAAHMRLEGQMLKSCSGSRMSEEQWGHEWWLQEQHRVWAGERSTRCFPPRRCSSSSRVRKGSERGNAELR